MPEKFYNPYHFVPVKGEERSDDIKREEFECNKISYLTHNCYVNKDKVYSGRIICRIITEDPIFIGSEREKLSDESHRVSHFELNGKPSIPASTIRGMISSIAEAASNSALRVLEEKQYSRRAEMRESLGAIGIIVKEKDGLRLRPLALPPLQWNNNEAKIPTKYQKMFTRPMLKVYINGYKKQNEEIAEKPCSFLSKNDPNSYCADNSEFWYIKLAGCCSFSNNTVQCTKPLIKTINTLKNEKIFFLTGQEALCDPISEKEYEEIIDPNEKKKYIRGILRVLGIEGRENNIPTTKKHEIFIPYPPEMENYPTFDVQDAIKKFESIAKERSETSNSEKENQINKKLPYSLKGSNRNDDPSKDKDYIKIRENDIVFFEVSDSDPEKVEEIAISSIWRKGAGGSSYDYFKKISSELIPFNPERELITIAEQLFGFVENIPKDEKDKEALSFASRLKFSFGILDEHEKEPYQTDEVLLKVLDSPKPPCPSFYFKHKKDLIGGNNFIAKKSLNLEDHIPQGRKFYLHKQDSDKKPWKTNHENENLSQKSRIKPLRKGLNFYFHIDFDNLSRRELSLLCYAIKPSENYRHKIGMGKPIGLGKIQIIPEGLFIIDRSKRYNEDDIFSSSRYHRSWVRKIEDFNKLPDIYAKEKQSLSLNLVKEDFFEKLRNEFANYIDKDIKKAIELIGEPQNVKYPVHTPQLAYQQDIEKENFRWFVENEKKGVKSHQGQGLKPLNECSKELPTLKRDFN